ncbi:hypothetical protein BD779DRAFT_1484210 [Infundibulicybe gibba]|nr:hypothetical protein BD779DRAFT_1484210 [Infundibulicybe gibba]
MPSHLLTIPAELAERILVFAHPIDVLRFSHTCKAAHSLIHHTTDHYLWRELWLRFPFDDPRNDSTLNIDWKTQLFNRMRAERLLADPTAVLDDNKDVLQTLVSIVKGAASTTIIDEATPSADLEDIQLQHRPTALRARLRSYFALPCPTSGITPPRQRTLSRARVYDLRNYHPANDWGPFLPDASGRTDWTHIEHILIVISENLDELPGWRWVPRPPVGLQATRAYSAPGCADLGEDWAGVQGSWRRYISFMDYRLLSLIAHTPTDYNFSTPSRPRNLAIFEDPQFHEATRLIDIELRLAPASTLRHIPLPPRPSSALVGEPDTGDDLARPLLGFSGTAKGINNHFAMIEGAVWMQPGVGVRWRFVSVYDGLAQWSSEGMQLGNVASACGVVGNWTSSHHDVGPFWMWKVAGI